MNIQPTSLPVLYQISRDFVMFAGAGRAVAYHVASGDQLGKEGFVQYCTKHYGDVALVDNEGLLRSMASGACWWNWADASKRTVRRVVMEPTNVPEDDEEADSTVFNRWYLLKQEMAEPDPDATHASIMILIEHLMFISDGDREGVLYFLNWLAQLWRFPDVKIPTAIMLYSKRGGVGKTVLSKLIAHVFGKSLVASCTGHEIQKNFMDAIEHKRIVVLNEMASSDRKDGYERFKSMISEENVQFEGKGRASKEVRNVAHYIVTTNNEDALPLMQNDRRFLVLRCESERKDNEYYKRLVDWIDGPGPELLAGVFSRWTFTADWDPHAPAPQTEASRKTQLASRSGLHLFIEDLIAQAKPPFDKDLGRYTGLIEQLNTLYPGNMKGLRLNNKTLPSALADLGAVQLPTNYASKTGTRISCNVWCWRNIERWRNEVGEVRAAHFDI